MNLKKIICMTLIAAAGSYAFAARLANEDKRGLRASSIEGLLRLKDDEIDIATAALLASRQWGANKTLNSYRGRIDEMAETILSRMAKKNIPADWRAIPLINQYLFDEAGFSSVETADDPEDLFLHRVLDKKKGYCLSLSVLYLSITERLGLPVYGVVVPGHFFVRYDDGQKRINIETTSKGGYADDEHYIEKFAVPADRTGLYLKNLSVKQTLGCFFNNLGNSYTDVGNMEQAFVHLQRAVQINPKLAEAHTNMGNLYLRKKMPEEALRHYEQAASILGSDFAVFNNIGNAYMELGQYGLSEGYYIRAIEIKRDATDTYRNLAQAYLAQNKIEQAMSYLRSATALKPDDWQNWTAMGNCLRKAGRYDEAIRAFQKALRLKPDEPSIHTGLGYACLDAQLPQDALNEFLLATAQGDGDTSGWFGLAQTYNALGQAGREIDVYLKLLSLAPKMTAAMQNLGNAYMKEQRCREAVEIYARGLLLEPQNTDLHYNLAVAYAKMERYGEAIGEYRQVIKLAPQQAAAYHGLAVCLYMTKQYDLSRQAAQKAKGLGCDVPEELLNSR